jgi:hypothetical protein
MDFKLWAILRQGNQIIFGQRSCYKFGDTVEYEVDWGNGEQTTIVTSGGVIPPWTQYGHIVSERVLLKIALEGH